MEQDIKTLTARLLANRWLPRNDRLVRRALVDETFRVELICIVDAIDHGTLVWRTPERNLLLPSTRLFHWAKRGFEWNYLRQYR